jgi:hypothetical protein
VDASGDAGEDRMIQPRSFAWSPARRIISLVSSGKGASEGVKGRGCKAPFLVSMLKELGDCHEAFCRAGKGKA